MKSFLKKLAACAGTVLFLLGTAFPTGEILTSHADEPITISYSGFSGSYWSVTNADIQLNFSAMGFYFTAFQADLQNIPANLSGSLEYQIYTEGLGWQNWAEKGTIAGTIENQLPMEAVRMRLTGQLESYYDICYTVFQNGVWTPWITNGNDAGMGGTNVGICGIGVAIIKKPIPTGQRILDPSKPMIALTFDDGPNGAVTDRILQSLEANGGKATFFMVGNRVFGGANTASVQKMAQLGCEVGNHTFDHKTLTKIGSAEVRNQLLKANQTIAAAGGVSPVIMRPPGGAKDASVLSVAGNLNMSTILWSIDTLDWKTRNKQKTIDAVLSRAKDGDIVLMHDLYTTTADAAEVIIPALTARGFQLVTVSELAAYRGGMAPGRSYSSFTGGGTA